MSIAHTLAYNMIMKNKREYNPQNPRDYVAEQMAESNDPAGRVQRGLDCAPIQMGITTGEFISASKNPQDKVVMYIHGGGFVSGTAKRKSDRMMSQYIADKMGYNVVSVDYRLAPTHPFPAAAEDCFSAYAALEKQYEGKNIALMGGSAGGNLALSVILQAKAQSISLPACAVVVSPVVQYDQVLPSHHKNLSSDCMVSNLAQEVIDIYLQTEELSVVKNPYAAPLYGDLGAFPPTWIIASESEVLRDDAVLFHEKLKQADRESHLRLYPDLMHAFAMMPIFPEAKQALQEVQPFMDKYLQRL